MFLKIQFLELKMSTSSLTHKTKQNDKTILNIHSKVQMEQGYT